MINIPFYYPKVLHPVQGIDKLMIEPCCTFEYYPKIETCVNEKQVKKKEWKTQWSKNCLKPYSLFKFYGTTI